MLPIVHGLEAEYFGQVDFVYLDRERPENRAVVDHFGVRSQPVLILLDAEGREVRRWFGGMSAEQIRAALDGL